MERLVRIEQQKGTGSLIWRWGMETKEYMSLEVAAEKWHSKSWYIAKACNAGQIQGAAKMDGTWIIPADLERPQMYIPNERPTPSPIQHGSYYKDMIYNMTMSSFPDFNVIEKKIGRTTYYISAGFDPAARETLEEKLIRIALREYYTGKTPSDVQAEVDKLREKNRKNIPTDDQLRKYYLAKFTEIGFSQEEITVLMSKINEHIETRNKSLQGGRR